MEFDLFADFLMMKQHSFESPNASLQPHIMVLVYASYVFALCLPSSHSDVVFPCSEAILSKKPVLGILDSFFWHTTNCWQWSSKAYAEAIWGQVATTLKNLSLVAYGHIVFERVLSFPQVYQMDFLHITSQVLLQNIPVEQQQYVIPLAIVIWTLASCIVFGRN